MINSIVSQGLIWAILGLGIFMTFRILDFPDMTTEGSFPLGGAVAVTLITKGVNPLLATLAAIGAGCLAGSGLIWDFWAIKKFRNFFLLPVGSMRF